MSVKIENMDIPRSCMGCPLARVGRFGYDFCCITDRIVQKFSNERPDFCPLKECK